MPRRAQKRKYFAGTSPCGQMTGTRRTPEAACGAGLHRQHASLAVLAGFPQDGLWHRERAPRKSADALFSVVIHFWILRPRPAGLRHGLYGRHCWTACLCAFSQWVFPARRQ